MSDEGRPPPAGRHDTVERAIGALAEGMRQLVARHPWGSLLGGESQEVEVTLRVPISSGPAELGRASREAREALEEAVHGLLAERLTFRPGRVFCLRCGSADCEHATPPSSRSVFAGYGSTGLPRFVDFQQLLVELQDERVSALFEHPPRLVAVVQEGRSLTAGLLPVFHQRDLGFRLHGQVSVGLYRPEGRRDQEAVALSLQLISTRPRGRRWRLGLNAVGVAPDGLPLETLYDRWGSVPWDDALRWGRETLAEIESSGRTKGSTGRKKIAPRLQGLVQALARRLLKGERSAKRRTRHAEERRRQERPTHMALADLASAGADEILYDTRRQTLIVLGERGRAHVFNQDGKLVTSVRYSPASIARRRSQGSWRPASSREAADLRLRVGSA